MLKVIKAGLQTTVQGAPRLGWRHWGIPYAGAADALSMALANRLVGNSAQMAALEITGGGFEAEFTATMFIAVCGADVAISLNGVAQPTHTTLVMKSGDHLGIAHPSAGLRTYLASAAGFKGDTAFGSVSTYLPGRFGGFAGRALMSGDVIAVNQQSPSVNRVETPQALRPVFTREFALRACPGAEYAALDASSKQALYETNFVAARQGTRMGFGLEGRELAALSNGQMLSAAVYPGMVQCPTSGQPFLLGCDAQTTGGYPRIAQIARCDRHLIGQIGPGHRLCFLHRTPEAARTDYTEKMALLRSWLPDFDLI